MKLKVGQVWRSKHSDRTFTIVELTKTHVVVDVDRSIPNKGDPSRIEKRRRSVARNEFGSFSSPYESE